jgi:hypothetical protein
MIQYIIDLMDWLGEVVPGIAECPLNPNVCIPHNTCDGNSRFKFFNQFWLLFYTQVYPYGVLIKKNICNTEQPKHSKTQIQFVTERYMY